MEDLAGFAAGAEAIAFDLTISAHSLHYFQDANTFRFRHDLQFMDSRGSAVARRGVKRSMLTVGRDMTEQSGQEKGRRKQDMLETRNEGSVLL